MDLHNNWPDATPEGYDVSFDSRAGWDFDGDFEHASDEPTLVAADEHTEGYEQTPAGGDKPRGGFGGEGPDRRFITDPELSDLLTRGAEALGGEGLDRVLRASQRFDQVTTIVRHEDGSESVVEHFQTRRVLEEVPAYAEAAAAAELDAATANDLLIHAIDAHRFDFGQPNTSVLLLGRALEASAGEEPLTVEDTDKIKALITKASPDDAVDRALYAYALGRRLGLSIDDSIALPGDYLDSHNYRQIGYHGAYFTGALDALTEAQVDPQLIKTTFDEFIKLHPEESAGAYDVLREAITFICPAVGMTPAELLQAMTDRVAAGRGNIVEALMDAFESQQLPAREGEPIVVVPQHELERRFLEKPGELEFSATSYRTERSLNDGMRDIERLTDANYHRWERVGEGNWTFDPASQTWYSLGGETTYIGGGVRHRSIFYEQSALSETPVSVHIHPEAYAVAKSDKLGFVFPSNADYRAVATMMENALNPVRLSSLISHPLGITKFDYPQDSAKVRQISERAEAIWKGFMTQFGSEDNLMAMARQVGEYDFARWAVAEINRLLPTGFTFALYPRGTDFEKVIAGRQ